LAADGAQSVLLRKVLQHKLNPARQSAGLRQYYQGVEGLHPDGFIELHFLKGTLPGYLWVFPLPDGRANVGVGMRSDVVARKRINLKEMMANCLKNDPELRLRFANATPEESPKGFGLPMAALGQPVLADRLLLLGDAAALIDPFTGEGIGNAMLSGLYAADTLAPLWASQQFEAQALAPYQQALHRRLAAELRLGLRLQQLVRFPWLFNLVVHRARHNPELRDTITCMFDDIDLRARFRQPGFYFRLLFGGTRKPAA
jgi:flavin-dependent dehydrogenase